MTQTNKNSQSGSVGKSTWLGRFHSSEKRLASFEMWLAMLCGAVILFFMLFTTADVVGRYFFNRPIYGQVDIISMLSAGFILLAVSFSELRKANVRVDVILEHIKGRPYHAVEALFTALSMIPTILFAVYLVVLAVVHHRVGQTTSVMLLPTWPFLILAGIGFGVMFVRLVMNFIQHVICSSGKERSN